MLYISSACLIIAKSLLLESGSKKEFWLLNCFQLSLLLTSQVRPLICECNFASDEIAWHVSSNGCPRKTCSILLSQLDEKLLKLLVKFLVEAYNIWSVCLFFSPCGPNSHQDFSAFLCVRISCIFLLQTALLSCHTREIYPPLF